MKKCPNCEVIMNEVLKTGIAIDVCPKCMGIWLDKGELEKIIELSTSYESRNENSYRKEGHDFYDDEDDHHGDRHDKHYDEHDRKITYDKNGRPIRKKGGFADILGGLFD